MSRTLKNIRRSSRSLQIARNAKVIYAVERGARRFFPPVSPPRDPRGLSHLRHTVMVMVACEP